MHLHHSVSDRSLLARSRLGLFPLVEVLNFAAKLGLLTEGEKRSTLLVVICNSLWNTVARYINASLRAVPCTQLTFAKLLIVKAKQ